LHLDQTVRQHTVRNSLWLLASAATAAAEVVLIRPVLLLAYVWLPLQSAAVLGVSLALAALLAWRLWFKSRVYLLDFVAKRPDDR
jgi:hypothetical protein